MKEVLEALRRALESDPKNGPLWIHYAEVLRGAGELREAILALRTAAELEPVRLEASRKLVPLLRETGQLAEALIRAEALLEQGEDPELRRELELVEAARGGPAANEAPPEALAEVSEGPLDTAEWAKQFDWGHLRVTFDDVAGLEDVKRQIRLRVLAPMQKPDVYRAFKREGGGGLLLYGPPGCGKTFVARATAGEIGARFVSVTIHEVVDKYWGESEKLVHALFEDARRNQPTVLFFDEFDAMGSARGKSDSSFWRTLVDQLLQEMDGVGQSNAGVLVFAATNMPWTVDSAFRRPGRFDRVLLVPPPDLPARESILARHAAELPGGAQLDLSEVAKRTELYTGADLRALCERAAERALEQSLAAGSVHEVSQEDLRRALADSRSTALEWLSTARNYARYSNEGGQYDELVAYLKKVKRW